MKLMDNLSLIEFPFLIKLYTKDLVLELCYSKYIINGNFGFWTIQSLNSKRTINEDFAFWTIEKS